MQVGSCKRLKRDYCKPQARECKVHKAINVWHVKSKRWGGNWFRGFLLEDAAGSPIPTTLPCTPLMYMGNNQLPVTYIWYLRGHPWCPHSPFFYFMQLLGKFDKSYADVPPGGLVPPSAKILLELQGFTSGYSSYLMWLFCDCSSLLNERASSKSHNIQSLFKFVYCSDLQPQVHVLICKWAVSFKNNNFFINSSNNLFKLTHI